MADVKTKPEPFKSYICSFSGCSAAYNKQWKLDSHLCKHTGVKPHACPQPDCGKSFSDLYHLSRHALTHSKEKPFKCTEPGCTESFTTNANRVRHVSRIHAPNTKKYACPFENCGLEFRKHKLLKCHMCEQHAAPPPCACTYPGCNMAFTFPSKLKRHEKVHRGYPCPEEGCEFTGKTWTEYLKHKKEQHRTVLTCQQCNRAFGDSWLLQQHQRVHSDTRVVYRCPRDSCDRSFTKIFNLQSHIRSFHENIQPFACDHPGCGKAFAMKQSLQRHGVIHDPDRRKRRKPRPKRSLVSRLSGYKDGVQKKAKDSPPKAPTDQPAAFKLTSILQSITVVDSHEITDVLAAPGEM